MSGMKLATAYYELIPSMGGSQKTITKEFTGVGKSASKSFGGAFSGGLKSSLAGIKKPVIAAGASIVAALGVKKLVSSTTGAFKELALEVIQFKRVAGGSVEDASRLRFAVQNTGVDVQKATSAFGIFSKKLGAAQGDTKKAATLTAQLGTSFTDAKGGILPLAQLLPKVSDKFSKMQDGPEKTALAMQLFGKSGRDVLPFLNKGSKGIAELMKKSDQLGLTLDQNGIDKFGEYRQASRDFGATMQGLKVTIGSALLPVFTRMTQFMTTAVTPAVRTMIEWFKTSDIVKAFGSGVDRAFSLLKAGLTGIPELFSRFIKSAQGSKTIAAIMETIGVVVDELRNTFSAFSPIVNALFGGAAKKKGDALGGTFSALNVAVRAALTPIRLIAVVVGSVLAPALANTIEFVKRNASAFKVVGAIIGTIFLPALIQATVAAVASAASALALNAAWLVYGITTKAIAIATKAWTSAQWLLNVAMSANPITLIILGITALIAGIVLIATKTTWFQTAWKAAWGAITGAVSATFDWIKRNWPLILAVITGPIGLAVLAVVKNWDQIKAATTKAFNAVKKVVQTVLGAVVGVVKTQIAAVKSAISGIAAIVGIVRGAFDRMKSGAETAAKSLVSYVKELPGKIVSALGDLGGLLVDAGKQAVAGLVGGMTRAAAEMIPNAVKSIAGKVSGGLKSALRIKSPSRVTMAIGRFVTAGLAKGLAQGSSGLDAVLKAMTKKITDSLSLKKAKPGMSKKQRAAISAYNDRARAQMKAQKVAVEQLGKSLAGLSKKIDKANSKLKSLKDSRAQLSAQVRDSIRGELDLGSLAGQTKEGGFAVPTTFAAVKATVSGLAARAKSFAGKLKKLLKAGIPAGLVQEVAALGTQAGMQVADALLSGSKTEIGQLAADYKSLNTYSSQVGDIVAGGMFDVGIKAQEGILKGLLDDKAIDRAAKTLSKKLTKSIKKELGIKSPSRKMRREVGRHLPTGVVDGIDDSQSILDARVARMVDVPSIGDVAPGDLAGGFASSQGAPFEFDYDRLADAMSRRPQTITIGKRQFALTVLDAMATIERQT